MKDAIYAWRCFSKGRLVEGPPPSHRLQPHPHKALQLGGCWRCPRVTLEPLYSMLCIGSIQSVSSCRVPESLARWGGGTASLLTSSKRVLARSLPSALRRPLFYNGRRTISARLNGGEPREETEPPAVSRPRGALQGKSTIQSTQRLPSCGTARALLSRPGDAFHGSLVSCR
jgi:hypothetical protein